MAGKPAGEQGRRNGREAWLQYQVSNHPANAGRQHETAAVHAAGYQQACMAWHRPHYQLQIGRDVVACPAP